MQGLYATGSEPIGSSPDGSGATGDVSAPVMNGSLSSSSITSSSFVLSWLAASDDVGVVGYEVSTSGGASWADVGNVLTSTRSGMPPSTLISTQVRAYDAAYNYSAPLSLGVTTSAAAGGLLTLVRRGSRSRYTT